MSGITPPGPAPDALELAALLCSRVCHDLISPVGAIVNGLEVLDDNPKPEDREFALELIRKSAKTASARLQFCRLAFGAAGSAGAQIDLGDAQAMARGVTVTGNPLFWVVVGERLYLFGFEANRDAFAADPQTFLAKAQARWPALEQGLVQ